MSASAPGVSHEMAPAGSACRRTSWLARHRWSLLVGAATLLALALRLHGLEARSIWWDEGWSVALARMSIAQMAESTAHDVHPPLYYLLLRLWGAVAGEGEFALRFLCVCFGVVLVPLSYRLGRALLTPLAGVLTALLVTVSPFCVAWAQETRMYVIASALGVASTWLAVRLWQDRRGFWAYCLTSIALLYTLYLGIVYFLVQNVAWSAWFLAGERKGWRRWVATQGLVALCFSPWLAYALARTRTWSVADPIPLGGLLHYYWAALVTGTSAYVERHTPVLVLLAVCLLVAVGWLGRCCREGKWWRAVLLLAGALVPPLVVYVMSQPRGFLYSPRPEPRYLNPFAPFVYLLWAGGVANAWLRRRQLALALAAVAMCGLALSLPRYYAERTRSDDFESMACTLKTYVQAGDAVLLHTDHDWPAFAYYFDREYIGVPNAAAWDTGTAAAFVEQHTAGRTTVWLAITTDAIRADPGMSLEQSLRSWCGDGCVNDEWRFGEQRLLRLSRGDALPEPSLLPAQPLPGHGGVVAGWWARSPLALGGEWRAYLWWDGTGAKPELVVTSGSRQVTTLAPTVEPEERGATVRLAYAFAPAEAGRYEVSVRAGRVWPLAALAVQGRTAQANDTGASARVPVAAAFLGGVFLDAYSVADATPAAGEDICVTLVWRTTTAVAEPYAVFVHLLGDVYNARYANFLWGQHDGQPADGTRPLPSWRPGETITDRHCFRVDADAAPGSYSLEVGLYDRGTGERLPLTNGGDSVIVGSVEVQ